MKEKENFLFFYEEKKDKKKKKWRKDKKIYKGNFQRKCIKIKEEKECKREL